MYTFVIVEWSLPLRFKISDFPSARHHHRRYIHTSIIPRFLFNEGFLTAGLGIKYVSNSLITTLIFDFDGTLANCPYDFAYMRQSIMGTACEFGLAPARLDSFGLLESIAEGTRLLEDDTGRAGAFRELAISRLSAIEYEAAAETHLLPGVTQALLRLRGAGYRLGIVTRNSAAAVERVIGNIALPVNALLTREAVAYPKPHPMHAEEMLALLKSTPAQSLMVGDHPTDILMGKQVGMGTVAVLTGQSSEADLRASAPDWLLPSVLELTAMLFDGKMT